MPRRLLSGALTAAIFLAPAGAGAQTPAQPAASPSGLDLRGCVAYALGHSPDILSRKATLAQDEEQFTQARANELPPVTGLLQNQVQKSSNTSGAYAQLGLTPANVFSQNTASIGSNWTLFNGSAYQIQAQQAKRVVEAARDDLRRAEDQLAQTVTNAFFAVAQNHAAVGLQQFDRTYQQQLVDNARINERVGRAAGVDVLRAESDELRAQAALTTAISNEATARETLASTIGAPPETPFAVPDVIPEPPVPRTPLASLIEIASAGRPDIASAKAQLADAELGNSLINTNLFPVLQVSGSFGNQTSPTEDAALGASNAAYARQGLPQFETPIIHSGFWQIGATETLQIGLIDYGLRASQHRAARAQIDSAVANLSNARHAVETDVRQAVRGVETATANLASYKAAAQFGAESARISQLQYHNGLISLTDATQAEQTNVSAQSDLVAARVAYVEAIVHLRVSLGTLEPLAVVDVRNA
jgi:outer membrane protein TolC